MNKKVLFSKMLSIMLAGSLMVFASCNKDDDDPIVDDDNNTEEMIVIDEAITADKTLKADKKYLLKGNVYVQAPAVLTIEAGCHVFGDKATKGALVINRGAQINAQGTAADPIIMTSSAPEGYRNKGDWGGIVILGNGISNKGTNLTIEGVTGTSGDDGIYGAANNADNSGTLTYVRVEFAGVELTPNNELNSVTMGAVGSGTTMHHIMVSYAGDDAFEWFGGAVDMDYLIAYKTWDDDFDSDNGYAGKVQYAAVFRNPSSSDQSGSNAFEASSNSNAGASPHSSCKFANITVIGPRAYSNANITTNKSGIEANTNTAIEIYNSIIVGWPTGITYNAMGNGAIFSELILVGNTTTTTGTAPTGTAPVLNTGAALADLYGTGIVMAASSNGSNFTAGPLNLSSPAPLLDAASTYKTGAPDLSGQGFTTEAFYGAFGTTEGNWNWSSNWVEFDPINAEY